MAEEALKRSEEAREQFKRRLAVPENLDERGRPQLTLIEGGHAT